MKTKYEEAREDLELLLPKVIGSKLSLFKFKKYENIMEFINEAETTEKRLEELERDVKILNDSIEFTFDDFIWRTEMGMAIKRLINVGKTK